MINKYNGIASLYYPIAHFIYGSKLLDIQKLILSKHPPSGKMLILGGGNGEILAFILNNFPQLEIDYVEASSQMLNMAQKASAQNQRINFIHGDQIPTSAYNSIFCPFVLDCFTLQELEKLSHQFKEVLQNSGHLYIVDFYKSSHWLQALTLKLSILFFRLSTNHPNTILHDVFEPFENNGYKSLNSCYLQKTFIRASCMELHQQ